MTYGNLVEFDSLTTPITTLTVNSGDLTVVVNKNEGTITLNGMYTGDIDVVSWQLGSNKYNFPFDVIISGIPAGSGDSTYYIGGQYIGLAWNNRILYANNTFGVRLAVCKNIQCNNVVFRPMFRPTYSNVTDWNPYSMRVQDLTTNVLKLRDEQTVRRYKYVNTKSEYILFASDRFSNGGYKRVLRCTSIDNTMISYFSGFFISRFAIISLLYIGDGGDINTGKFKGEIHNILCAQTPEAYSVNLWQETPNPSSSVYDAVDLKNLETWDTSVIFGRGQNIRFDYVDWYD